MSQHHVAHCDIDLSELLASGSTQYNVWFVLPEWCKPYFAPPPNNIHREDAVFGSNGVVPYKEQNQLIHYAEVFRKLSVVFGEFEMYMRKAAEHQMHLTEGGLPESDSESKPAAIGR